MSKHVITSIDVATGTFEIGDTIELTPPCGCRFRRARARYWRIAYGYLGLGVALGVAIGMVLGAASKVCAP